jgi:HEAT repeat protein
MPLRSRLQWLAITVLATGVVAIRPIAAQTSTEAHQLSIDSMIYDLNSPDPVRRQAAVRDLGAARFQLATPKLVALVHDPSDAVRREVELSLEKMEDPQALPGFIALASDMQPDIRSRAVSSLVNIHLPRTSGVGAALTKLGELIVSAPDRDLELVVEPDVPVDPMVVETLRSRIGDPERRIRRTAIRGLGILRARPAVPDLLQVVRADRDDSLRFDAVRAIRKIGDPSTGEQLIAFLNINGDTVRNELIETLGSMRYQGAVPELTRIVEQSKETDKATILALAALADIADPTSVPVFERLKADTNEGLRLYACEGLARTADVSQKAAISADRLVERSARVRTAQAFALLRIGEAEYLDELIRALEHSSTRDLAKEYLVETQPAHRPALFAPRTASATTRAELADVMGQMKDPDALPTLQQLARDSDEDVARAAGLAVRRISVVTGQ